MAYIGELVQELRKDCGWTQRELAEKLGVHPSQVSRLERGTTKDVGIELVLKLAEVFEVSTDYLLGRSKVREVQNHSISSLGLSEKAVRQLLKGELDVRILNLILEHEDFPKLLRQIGFYFNRDTASVLDARNKAIEQVVQSVNEIGTVAGMSHAEGTQAVNHLNAARIPVDEPDLRIIRTGLIKILRDIRSSIQQDTPMSGTVTEDVFDALRRESISSPTAPTFESLWDILETQVNGSRFTPEIKSLTLQFFQRFWKLTQDTASLTNQDNKDH